MQVVGLDGLSHFHRRESKSPFDLWWQIMTAEFMKHLEKN